MSARAFLALALGLPLVACAPEAPPASPGASPSVAQSARPAVAPVVNVVVPDALRRVLAAEGRSADDRALDEPRRSAELVAFAGVAEGARVGEVGSWEGYTAELLGRVVGDSGHVYAEDPKSLEPYIHKAWDARATRREVLARVTHLYRPFEDPFGAEARGLSAVFSVMFYHDTVWLGVDRGKMNAAVLAALAPGGQYIVVDHAARPGEGTTVAKTLHRIEEATVIEEITRAGFTLAARADFLRHPEDPRDWNAGDEGPKEKRGKSDRFVLRFVRP